MFTLLTKMLLVAISICSLLSTGLGESLGLFNFFTLLDLVSVSYFSRTRRRAVCFGGLRGGGGGFLSVSLSIKKRERDENGSDDGEEYVGQSREVVGQNGNKSFLVEAEEIMNEEGEKKVVQRVGVKGSSSAMNMTKHLWAGAIAAMVSRTILAVSQNNSCTY